MKIENIYNSLPSFIQNVACSAVGYKIKKHRYSKRFFKYLEWLEETQYWSKEKIREYQEEQLEKTILHAYNTVPYYNKLFYSLKLKPKDIKNSEDLYKLPILTKQTVRDNWLEFLSSDYKVRELVKVSTSGTTGAGVSFMKHPDELTFQAALWWRFRDRFDLNLNDWHANFSGKRIVPLSWKRGPFWRYNLPFRQVYFSAYHIDDENLFDYYQKLNSVAFKYYCGYPSVITSMAIFMLKNNLKLDNPPNIIATGSESLLPRQVELIREAFECNVVDFYGSAENVCTFSKCKLGTYHNDFEVGLVEFVPIKESDFPHEARVVATGFMNVAMPLIRYDMKDCVFVDAQSKCSCGMNSSIVLSIDGRSDDVIKTPSGKTIGRLAGLFANLNNVFESQVVQVSLYKIIVKIVKKEHYTEADEVNFHKRLSEVLGEDMEIKFDYCKNIPKEKNGKFRVVKSLI
jgi:phenylacetate-CoA ligase